MSDEDVRKTIDDTGSYDQQRENLLRSMIRDGYSRQMRGTLLFVWAWALVFMGLAVFCGVAFFYAERTREQIMYAAGFLTAVQGILGMKIFAWQAIHRNSVIREIKRLEARLLELQRLP
jgi:cytochrome c biogenesis protein CcdA